MIYGSRWVCICGLCVSVVSFRSLPKGVLGPCGGKTKLNPLEGLENFVLFIPQNYGATVRTGHGKLGLH